MAGLPAIFFGLGNYNKPEWEQIKMGQLDAVRIVCGGSDIVESISSKVIPRYVSKGIKVNLNVGGVVYKPNERFDKFIRQVFIPFAREAVKKAMYSGLVSWTMVPWKQDKLFNKPVLVRDSAYYIVQKFGKEGKEYAAINTEKPKWGASDYDQEIDRKIHMTPIKCWEPDDLGRIRSPMSQILDPLQQYNELWSQYTNAAKNYVKPLLIFESGDIGKMLSSLHPYAQGSMNPDDVGEFHREMTMEANAAAFESMAVASTLSMLKRQGYNITYNPSSQTRTVTRPDDMLSNTHLNPMSQKLGAQVTPSAIPDFTSSTQHLLARIMEVMGVPTQMMYDQSAASKAVVAELMMVNLNQKIQDVQKDLSVAFTLILQELMSDHLLNVYNKEVWELEEKIGRGLRKEESKKVRENVEVTLEFEHEPFTSFETLVLMNQNNIIGHETLAKYALRRYGMPESEAMSEEDILKETKKRKRLMDILEPPEEKTAQNGKGKSPAKKAKKPEKKKAKTTSSNPKPKSTTTTTTTKSSSASKSSSKSSSAEKTAKDSAPKKKSEGSKLDDSQKKKPKSAIKSQ